MFIDDDSYQGMRGPYGGVNRRRPDREICRLRMPRRRMKGLQQRIRSQL